MKKMISALTAAAMTASMSASVLSAFAYSADEIGYYLKVSSTGNYTVSEDGKTITFASAADAKGASFKVQHFIDADTANPAIAQWTYMIQSDSAAINFNEEAAPYKGKYGEKKTYTAADGTTFETDNFVNTFGYLNFLGAYSSGTGAANFSLTSSFSWEYDGPNALIGIWSSSLDYPAGTTTAHFLGAKSDDFPTSEFEVKIDDTITDGTYTLSYGKGYEDGFKDDHPFIPMTTINDGQNHTITPGTLEGITIVVGDSSVTPPPTTEPTTEPPETDPTTEPVTEPDTGEKVIEGFSWVIGDVTFDPDNDKFVQVPVMVYGDPGTVGYHVELRFDGEKIADSLFDCQLVQDEGAYTIMDTFVPNNELCGVGASNGSKAENEVAEDGTTACSFVLTAKAGATFKPGQKIAVTFADDCTFSNDEKEYLNPNLVAGSITIAGTPDVTEPSTTEPTEPVTTEPPTTEPPVVTDPTDEPVLGDYLYGDVNKNGAVELVDIVLLNRFLTGYENQDLDDYQVVVANCSRSGESDAETTKQNLNGQDSIEILKYKIGLVASLPNQAS